MTKTKPAETKGYLPILIFSEGLLIGKRPFQNTAMSEKNTLFRALSTKFRRPTILQLNIEGLTASQMNILSSSLQFEALIILLQETYCTNAEKLVLPSFQLAGFSLSRKHNLATFVHERLRYTLFWTNLYRHQAERLCVDVDDYKIVTSTNWLGKY